MNPYLSDILAQPKALAKAVGLLPQQFSDVVQRRLHLEDFDRIVITGMGASLNAAYPAYMQLSQLPIPVVAANTAELVYYLNGAISPHTLVWINSQSGRSAEIIHLLAQVKSKPPGCILAFVNDETSPLARAADVSLPIYAGPETSVSTKTYLNTLAINLLAARKMAGIEIESARDEFLYAAQAIDAYLTDWLARVKELDWLVGDFETLFLIGRGASMSAVWNGSLINKEAARCSFEGINAAEFRHGPLELSVPGFCSLICAGDPATAGLNRNLAQDIARYGGRAIWLDSQPDAEIPTFVLPETPPLARPLAEIISMELLTLAMAGRKGIEPGIFQFVEKITAIE